MKTRNADNHDHIIFELSKFYYRSLSQAKHSLICGKRDYYKKKLPQATLRVAK